MNELLEGRVVKKMNKSSIHLISQILHESRTEIVK